MATLSTIHPTLLDVTKRLDPKGKIDTIAELLHEQNEVLQDCVWIEANGITGHRTTVRTGLPAPTWRKLYGGVQPTKSTTAQVTESMGMLEAYAEVDKALADLNGNTAAFRFSEEIAHIEGMNQEIADTMWYGNETTEPEAFTGFRPRFNAISGATNGSNVINGGGNNSNSDMTSMWVVVWGANTVHCLYPKGSVAGLKMEDKGQVTIESIDGAGGRMEAYRTHYRWDCGLCVRDWRYVVRICNLELGSITKAAAGSEDADLTDLLAQAVELIPNLSAGRPAIYVPRAIRSLMRRQIANKVGSSTLTMEQVGGKHVVMWDGIPVRRSDAISTNEGAAVT